MQTSPDFFRGPAPEFEISAQEMSFPKINASYISKFQSVVSPQRKSTVPEEMQTSPDFSEPENQI